MRVLSKAKEWLKARFGKKTSWETPKEIKGEDMKEVVKTIRRGRPKKNR